MTSPYTTLSTRIPYENPWTRLREDRIRRSDGSDGIYGVVERSDFAVVVPFHAGRVTLVEQYRYPVQARMWEFPMGMAEKDPDVDPAVLAAAELREETGLVAARMTYAGRIFQGPGYCNQRGHVFLATELTSGATAREVTEQDMVARDFPLPQIEAMIRDGVILDGMSIAAFGLLRLKAMI
jgi:8-oxo-dGTP pyrophosphatase MutT (NUDIX family)